MVNAWKSMDRFYQDSLCTCLKMPVKEFLKRYTFGQKNPDQVLAA